MAMPYHFETIIIQKPWLLSGLRFLKFELKTQPSQTILYFYEASLRMGTHNQKILIITHKLQQS